MKRPASVVCIGILMATAAAKLPWLVGSGWPGAPDPVLPWVSHGAVLLLAVVLEVASALSLAGVVPWVRPRPTVLHGFVLCCLAYRLHLTVQGRFTCSCLGVLPQWTPWLDASVISGVSWALLGVLGVGGILACREDAPAPMPTASVPNVPKS